MRQEPWKRNLAWLRSVSGKPLSAKKEEISNCLLRKLFPNFVQIGCIALSCTTYIKWLHARCPMWTVFFFSRLLSHGGYQLIRDKENARTKNFHSRHFLAPGTTFLISATYFAHLAMQEKTDYDKMPLAVTKPHVSNHSNFLMCCFWRRDITWPIESSTILV